jgi:hypothetical protein
MRCGQGGRFFRRAAAAIWIRLLRYRAFLQVRYLRPLSSSSPHRLNRPLSRTAVSLATSLKQIFSWASCTISACATWCPTSSRSAQPVRCTISPDSLSRCGCARMCCALDWRWLTRNRFAEQGRKRAGGIRLGEMERDSLLAHGVSFILQDRLMNCSDYSTVCSGIQPTIPSLRS